MFRIWKTIAGNVCSIPFFPQNRAVCEIMGKNVVHSDRLQMAIWRMRFPCWIPKATDTHSEYVMQLLSHGSSGYTNTPAFYEGWNFNFGNTPLDWIQELLE